MDTRAAARTVGKAFGAPFDGVDTLIRDLWAGKLDADGFATRLLAMGPAAFDALARHELDFPLGQRFVQPAIQARVMALDADVWPRLYELGVAAAREDARAVFLAWLDGAAPAIGAALIAADATAVDRVLGVLSRAPITPRRLVDAMVSTPRFDAALARVDAGDLPPPPAPPPPPPKRPGLDAATLGQALGRLVGWFTGASAPPTPQAPSDVLRARGPVVALRTRGAAIDALDDAGGTVSTDGAPPAWVPPSFDAEAFPVAPGVVLAHLALDADRAAVVGVCDDGTGFFAIGRRGAARWDHRDDDHEQAVLSVGHHPDGWLLGGADGSVMWISADLEESDTSGVEGGAPAGGFAIGALEIPLLTTSVRAILVVGDEAYLGLQDGRVLRWPLP